MATHCDYIDPETGVKCDWKGTKAGKAIHMAKIHGIHPEHHEQIVSVSLKDSEKSLNVINKGLLEPIVDRVGNLD